MAAKKGVRVQRQRASVPACRAHARAQAIVVTSPSKEGWLEKQSALCRRALQSPAPTAALTADGDGAGRHLKRWKRRWFVLQDHMLYSFKQKKVPMAAPRRCALDSTTSAPPPGAGRFTKTRRRSSTSAYFPPSSRRRRPRSAPTRSTCTSRPRSSSAWWPSRRSRKRVRCAAQTSVSPAHARARAARACRLDSCNWSRRCVLQEPELAAGQRRVGIAQLARPGACRS